MDALQTEHSMRLEQSTRRPFAWGSATLLDADDRSATWRLDLRKGMTLDSLSIPYAFDLFSGGKTHSVREQYVVTSGDVVIESRAEDAQHLVMGTGDAFEVDANDPLVIMCVEERSATLVLTAVAS